MAQRILILVADDDEIINLSPLTYLDTLYYELWYRIVGSGSYNQVTIYSPLETFTVPSPAGDVPCIVISPLPDSTDYEYQVRRFNTDNVPSSWFTGTFTTGS